MTMIERKISKENAYVLKEFKKGYKIPIISDTMFHTMLNNYSRKKYVSYLISLALNKDYEKIYSSIIFLNNKLDKENIRESSKTVDFVCTIDNEVIGIEMNNNTSKEALERNISYAADLYKSKMIRGRKYEYQKVVQININNFTFKGNNKIIEEYSLKNKQGEEFTDKLKFIHIYLPNIRKKYYNKDNLSELERLLLIFNEEEDLEKLSGGNIIMEDYIKEREDISIDDEVIGLYDKELHLEKLRLSEIYHAKEEGMKQEKLEIAKNMLKDNIELDIISKYTNLTKEELEKINQN